MIKTIVLVILHVVLTPFVFVAWCAADVVAELWSWMKFYPRWGEK